MLIGSFFTDNGALKPGLSPTIDIVDADTDTLIVNGAAMTTLTQMTHCYVYNFAAAVAGTNYAITVDGGATLDDVDRYHFATNEVDVVVTGAEDNIRGGLDTLATLSGQLDTVQSLIEDSLGISGQNTEWSAMAFDANHNLTSATITQYTDNTLVTPRKAWQLTATYNDDDELTAYDLVEV